MCMLTAGNLLTILVMTVKPKKNDTSTVNTSKLTTSAIMDTQTVSVTPSRELALVREYFPIPFANVKQMSDVLQSRRSELEQRTWPEHICAF
jgi:hypothetical protein